MRTDPAPSRGGGTNPLDALKRGRLGKAAQRGVVEDMTAEQQTTPGPAAEPAATAAVAPTPAEQLAQQPAPAEQVAPAVVTPAPQTPAAVAPLPAEPAVATPAVAAEPAVEPTAAEPAAAPAPIAAPAAEVAAPATKSPEDKPVKDSFYHSRESHRRLRSTYLETRHLTKYKSLSDFISSLIDQECTRLEELYNDGEPFSTDPNEMPRGRPVDG